MKTITKLYEGIIDFIKENYKLLLLYLVIFIVMTYPLPYYIYNGGGTIDVNSRVEVENSSESKGSYNLAYVSELRATLPTLFLSNFIKEWDVVKKEELTMDEDESIEEMLIRDKLLLDEANQNAVSVAFQKAGKTFKVKKENYAIAYIIKEAETDLILGDIVTSIDGVKISSMSTITDIINKKAIGEKVTLEYMRDNKKKTGYAIVKKVDNKKLLGLSFIIQKEYETSPAVKFNFSKNESGPSGGFMLSLALYDQLMENDLTNGRKIVGTGTITEDGTVGPIGGIKYKLKGAVSAKADLFLAPAGKNYEECIKLKEENNYDIEILSIASFDEAVEKLEK